MNLYILLEQDEPYMKPGLAEMKNAVVVPHIASASKVNLICLKVNYFHT
jgi:lactate dehydrogenase-like 2-hydroxyacid dehydrogenase